MDMYPYQGSCQLTHEHSTVIIGGCSFQRTLPILEILKGLTGYSQEALQQGCFNWYACDVRLVAQDMISI